jgi:hypothetical protein
VLLTKTFDGATYARALEDWSWLDLKGKTPVLSSLFGDVFLQDSTGYWFLDTLEGAVKLVAATRDELQAKLDSQEGQDNFLLGGLAMAADRKGMHLKADEVYDFQIPPVLGGATDLGNVAVMPFVVSLSIAGQLHDQVRKLPPGTKISGFEMVDDRLHLS